MASVAGTGKPRKRPYSSNRALALVSVERRQELFLKSLRASRTIEGAVETSGVTRSQHRNWLDKDEAYQDKYNETIEEISESLEREAIRRAVDGWDEPVYQGGILVGVKRKFSDSLLIFMLKGVRQEKYRETSQEVTGNVPNINIYLPENGRDNGDDIAPKTIEASFTAETVSE
jgi:hypothetical protein